MSLQQRVSTTHCSSAICRKIGVALRRFPEITTDTVALLDEWATRFFEELDYVKEGQNGNIFAEQMREALPQVTEGSFDI